MGDLSKVSEVFVDKTEKFIGALGTNYLEEFITTGLNSGLLQKGMAVLSDKRIYFKGSKYVREQTIDVAGGTGFKLSKNPSLYLALSIACIPLWILIMSVMEWLDFNMDDGFISLTAISFSVASIVLIAMYYVRDKKGFRKIPLEKTIDVADVTAIRFELSKNLLYLVLGVACIPLWLLLLIIINLIDSDISGGFSTFGLVVTIIALIVLIAMYFVKKRNLFIIQYAGGSIGFEVSWYTKDEIDKFSRDLISTRDNSKNPLEVQVTDGGVSKMTQPITNIAERLKEFFVDKNEKFISALGMNYLENFITNGLNSGLLQKGIAVLSDKRVYFKGTKYVRNMRGFQKISSEQTIDVSDVTGTGFELSKNPLYLVLAIACIPLFFLIVAVIGGIDDRLYIFITSAFIILMAMYFVKKRNFFIIQYAGGSIGFEVSWYTKDEIDKFSRNLISTRDNNKENSKNSSQAQVTVRTVSEVAQPSTDIAEQLKKYGDLLSSGLITQEEYNEVKAKLIKNI